MWGFYSYLKFKPSESTSEGFFSSTPQRLSERRKQRCKSLLPDKRPTQHPDWQVHPPTHSPTHPRRKREGGEFMLLLIRLIRASASGPLQDGLPPPRFDPPPVSTESHMLRVRASTHTVCRVTVCGPERCFPIGHKHLILQSHSADLSKNTVTYAKTRSQFD